MTLLVYIDSFKGEVRVCCRSELQDVLVLFQEAALLNLDCVDPDLQTGLGVLYNLSSDFSKAVEAFTAALSVRPEVRLMLSKKQD